MKELVQSQSFKVSSMLFTSSILTQIIGANLEMDGPRQPGQHDNHSKVEGAVAWNVFNNLNREGDFKLERR
jgi:hypothetical protein